MQEALFRKVPYVFDGGMSAINTYPWMFLHNLLESCRLP